MGISGYYKFDEDGNVQVGATDTIPFSEVQKARIAFAGADAKNDVWPALQYVFIGASSASKLANKYPDKSFTAKQPAPPIKIKPEKWACNVPFETHWEKYKNAGNVLNASGGKIPSYKVEYMVEGWLPLDDQKNVWYSHGLSMPLDELVKKNTSKFAYVTNDKKFVYSHVAKFGYSQLSVVKTETFKNGMYKKYPHYIKWDIPETVPEPVEEETPVPEPVNIAAQKGYRCIQCGHGGTNTDCECCTYKMHCIQCGQTGCVCCKSCDSYPCECTTKAKAKIVAPKITAGACHCLGCLESKGQIKINWVNDSSNNAPYTPKKAGQGSSDDAPWVKRGIKISAVTTSTSWKKIWRIDDNIDVCTAAADFYILEAISAGAVNNISGEYKKKYNEYSGRYDTVGTVETVPVHTWGPAYDHNPGWQTFNLKMMAASMLDQLSAKLASSFSEYCHMAIGGELRHHRAIAGDVLTAGERMSAWVGWKKVVEKIGPEQAMKDAAELFRESNWRSSYGGKKWAMACDIMVMYLTGQINDRIFVDRVFNLEHNCGSLLNKIEWKYHNDQGWNHNHVKTTVLPAHGSDPTDWKTLFKVASPVVRRMFTEYWDYMNKYRTHPFHKVCCKTSWEEVKNPGIVYWFHKCKYCNSNVHKGHDFACSYAQSGFSGPDQLIADSKTYKVDEADFPMIDPDQQYPVAADGSLNMDAPIKVNMSCNWCGSRGAIKTLKLSQWLSKEYVVAKPKCYKNHTSDYWIKNYGYTMKLNIQGNIHNPGMIKGEDSYKFGGDQMIAWLNSMFMGNSKIKNQLAELSGQKVLVTSG
jgi:hypothetical protein